MAESNPAIEALKAQTRLLAQIMARVDQLTPTSKSWLYDQLGIALGIKESDL